MKVNFYFFSVVILLLFGACKKQVIEKIAVIEYEDISLPNSADVTCFSFPTANVGYASCGSLYKTTNGGKSWSALTLSNVTSIDFINEKIGFCCAFGYLKKTIDGGLTWQNLSDDVEFVGITKKGVIMYAYRYNYSTVKVMASIDQGATFFYTNSIPTFNSPSKYKVTEEKLLIFNTKEFDVMYGVDMNDTINTLRFNTNATYQEFPTDVYFNNGKGALTGGNGYIGYTFLSSFDRNYYVHTWDYNSIDGYESLIVAVGENTIASNTDLDNDEDWNEVFDMERNGFKKTFLKVKFFNSPTFYIGGKNGLLWKANI